MKKKSEEYSSVQKALEIIKAFLPDGPRMGTLEISRKLNMHKSTVSRLIGVLTYHDFLAHDHQSKKYMLGPVISDLCKASSQSLAEKLRTIAQPHLDVLRDSVGESVGLEALINNEVRVIADSPGNSAVRVGFALNEKVALNAAAGTKAICAFSTPEYVESIMQGEFNRYTPNTITDLKSYMKHLEQVKKAGVAFDYGELNEEVHAIGAPVFGPETKPVAGVVVCMLESKLKNLLEQGLIDKVKRTAEAISQDLRLINLTD